MEDFELDTSIEEGKKVLVKGTKQKKAVKEEATTTTLITNPLRKEKVIVRYLAKDSGIWGNDPKHVFAGGMAETAYKVFVVPKLTSGLYVNILTDSEKTFLENALGLEPNALSVYKKVDNFWSDANPEGINSVKLSKFDNYFDLSVPDDYIKYKILLANKDFIAPSLEALQDSPKATYQYVIINEGSENKMAKSKMSYTMECYKEYGKIEDDKDKLRVIIEALDGRSTAQNSKIEFLQTKCNDFIQKDSRLFLKVIKDPYLDSKVLIKKSVEAGNIVKRGNYYYLRNLNETIPLCEDGEEPTLNIATKYLNAPKHQEVLLSLQAKLE